MFDCILVWQSRHVVLQPKNIWTIALLAIVRIACNWLLHEEIVSLVFMRKFQTFNPQSLQVKLCISKKMLGSKVPSHLDNFILICCRLQLLFIYFSAILSTIAAPPCYYVVCPFSIWWIDFFLFARSSQFIHTKHARICLMISYIFDVCNPLSSRLRGESFVQLQSAEFFVVVFNYINSP